MDADDHDGRGTRHVAEPTSAMNKLAIRPGAARAAITAAQAKVASEAHAEGRPFVGPEVRCMDPTAARLRAEAEMLL